LLAGAQPPNCVSCASFALATSTTDAFGTTTYAWDAKNRLVEVNGLASGLVEHAYASAAAAAGKNSAARAAVKEKRSPVER